MRTLPRWQVVEVDSAAPVIGRVLGGSEPRLRAAIPHRSPSCASDGVGVGSFYVAAASHVGLSHIAGGTPRQDAYNFALTTSGRLVVAVADGMGSRPQSQVGATHFCDSVAFAASGRPDDPAVAYLQMAAARAGDVAEVSYHLHRDAVSFVGAVAVIDGDLCEVARVGDVSAFAVDAKGEFTELFATDDGHLNVVGTSLPAAGPIEPEVTEVRGMQRIVLATDGLANDVRTSATVRSWLGQIWAGLPTAHAMSDALRYRRRGSHDDRTAVVIALPEPIATMPTVAGPPAAEEIAQ
jgi:serine/threonine protein phosphatase PrpC